MFPTGDTRFVSAGKASRYTREAMSEPTRKRVDQGRGACSEPAARWARGWPATRPPPTSRSTPGTAPRRKLDDLAETAGVETFATAREAVVDADVVVTMLSDADATLAAMSGPDGGAAGSEGAVWVQMGTIGVEGTERCAELARDRGLVYVDAPVLGTKKPAEEGQLVVLASGPEGAARAARTVLRRDRQTDDLARRGRPGQQAEGRRQQLDLHDHRGHRGDAAPGRRRSASNRASPSTRSRTARSTPPTCG